MEVLASLLRGGSVPLQAVNKIRLAEIEICCLPAITTPQVDDEAARDPSVGDQIGQSSSDRR
jgi:hypothetical protein